MRSGDNVVAVILVDRITEQRELELKKKKDDLERLLDRLRAQRRILQEELHDVKATLADLEPFAPIFDAIPLRTGTADMDWQEPEEDSLFRELELLRGRLERDLSDGLVEIRDVEMELDAVERELGRCTRIKHRARHV